MDGGGATGRGVGTCAGAPADKTIISRIMLRYRPIAPKPSSGSAGGGSCQASEGRNGFAGLGKRKRRYVRVSATKRNSSNSRRQRKPSGDSKEKKEGCRSEKDEVKTLRLLPDESAYPHREDSPAKEQSSEMPENWVVTEATVEKKRRDLGRSDLTMTEVQRPEMEEVVVVVEAAKSWVTVLSVTDICMNGEGLGCTDEERWRNLESDTFPGFISDADNHVWWSNAAYRKMVVGGDKEAAGAKVAVTLVVKELLPMTCPAFTCMVRVEYTWEMERKRRGGGKTVVVPCDVWRMSHGGFAWRLDLEAGLSLGL